MRSSRSPTRLATCCGAHRDDTARLIAEMGYEVLSLAYFDRNGSALVPESLEMIPLEYFVAPKKWLMERINTRNDGVIIYGLSKGAELALVLASHDKDYKAAKALFDDVTIFEMLGKEMALKSAENFRALRKKGITVRKTADVIIASFCIARKLPLLFSDKDFKPFVKHLGLREA